MAAAVAILGAPDGLHIEIAVRHGVVRGVTRHFIVKNRGQAAGGLLPVAEGGLVAGQVGQHHGQRGAELSPTAQAEFVGRLGGAGGCGGWDGDGRRVEDFLAVAKRDGACGCARGVHAHTHRKLASVLDLGAVVKARGDAGDEEVGQPSPGFDGVGAGSSEHLLLGLSVRGSRCGQLIRGWLEKCGLIRKQLKGESSPRLEGQPRSESNQRRARQAFRKLQVPDLASDVFVTAVLGRGRGQRFRQLRYSDAPRRPRGHNHHRGQREQHHLAHVRNHPALSDRPVP